MKGKKDDQEKLSYISGFQEARWSAPDSTDYEEVEGTRTNDKAEEKIFQPHPKISIAHPQSLFAILFHNHNVMKTFLLPYAQRVSVEIVEEDADYREQYFRSSSAMT